MKKIILAMLAICSLHNQLQAAVKTFINNSNKDFFVRVYYDNNKIMAATLAPGAVQDLFIPCDTIDKITVIDARHKTKSLSAMSHNELRAKSFPINDNMIFIINQNSSIKMYQGTTSRDRALQIMNECFVTQAPLPTLELTIHTVKTDKPWLQQQVDYTLQKQNSLLEA